MMKHTSIILFSLLLWIPAHSDTLYKYRDSEGTWTYSDRRPESGDYEVIFDIRIKDKNKPVVAEEPEVAETRSMDSVRTTLKTIESDINALYIELFEIDNATAGKVGVQFTITQEGTISKCQEDESGVTGEKFAGRICEKISALSFGPVLSKNPVNISYSYTFSNKTEN